MFNKLALATSLSAALLLATAASFASEVTLTDEIAKQITETLTKQGYEVGKIKVEDELFEAYTKKDGKKLEVFLNDKMEIVKTVEVN